MRAALRNNTPNYRQAGIACEAAEWIRNMVPWHMEVVSFRVETRFQQACQCLFQAEKSPTSRAVVDGVTMLGRRASF